MLQLIGDLLHAIGSTGGQLRVLHGELGAFMLVLHTERLDLKGDNPVCRVGTAFRCDRIVVNRESQMIVEMVSSCTSLLQVQKTFVESCSS
jgi:hypothetical protein